MKTFGIRAGLGALALAGTAAVALAASHGGGQHGEGKRDAARGGMLPFAQIDTDQDGKITAEEMAAYQAARFAAMDANGDGFVDAAELQAHMMAQAAERAEARAARMVSRMDTDGDGKLSAAEMQAGPRRDGASGDRFARMLERLDTDKDGALSREEWDAARAAWAERGPRSGPKAD